MIPTVLGKLLGAAVTDWTPFFMLVLSAIVLPGGIWLVKGQIEIDKKFTAHDEVDTTRFRDIQSSLTRIEGHQGGMDNKLDRVIERLIR